MFWFFFFGYHLFFAETKEKQIYSFYTTYFHPATLFLPQKRLFSFVPQFATYQEGSRIAYLVRIEQGPAAIVSKWFIAAISLTPQCGLDLLTHPSAICTRMRYLWDQGWMRTQAVYRLSFDTKWKHPSCIEPTLCILADVLEAFLLAHLCHPSSPHVGQPKAPLLPTHPDVVFLMNLLSILKHEKGRGSIK